MSSCEAEYYALVDGSSRALGLQAAAKELGIVAEDMVLIASTDSSAAKSYASRRGAGRIRHVEVKQLWLQQAVAEGRVRLHKVLGTENPADVLTKYKGLRDYQKLLSGVNVEVVGRSAGNGGVPQKEAAEEIGWLRLERGVRWAEACEEDEGEGEFPNAFSSGVGYGPRKVNA